MRGVTISILLGSLLILAPLALAHEEHHRGFCLKVLARDNAKIPDFRFPRWQLVEKVEYGNQYHFFHDTAQPMLIAGVKTQHRWGAIEYAWQVGEEKFNTTLTDSHDSICVVNVTGQDGNRYDLTQFYSRIRNNKELEDIPEGALRAYDSLQGKSPPHGRLEAPCDIMLKRGNRETRLCRILVFSTKDVAVMFYHGPAGGVVYPTEFRWLVEIRWWEKGKAHIWSRREITLDDGGRIILDPPLRQRPEFAPQAPDELF